MMIDTTEILSQLSTKRVWSGTELGKVFGITVTEVWRKLSGAVRKGEVVTANCGGKAHYALRKNAEHLRSKVRREKQAQLDKQFVKHSKKYDQCFTKYIKRRAK